ncbi:MAG: SDR family oxidoreductase, partial [bacterium]|nr:SDR family oxidoreductase [bacterium]
DPMRGMTINVGGTLQLLDTAAKAAHGLERFVFASSGAVYGPRSSYAGDTIAETDSLAPPNLYGVWKVAGEHLARLFHEKSGIPTVCLRLNTTYGKGRDKGKTAAPTTALKAVALGDKKGKTIPFRMPYHGRENYHHVEDVGAHFAACALDPFQGFGAFNIRGKTVEVTEFLDLIRQAAAGLGMGDA